MIKKITVRGIEFDVHEINFWAGVTVGAWEPETYEIMEKYLDKDHSYMDIGAWIGPTVLYGAHLAKKVYAFEPDPVAMTGLIANIELNPDIQGKIVPLQMAVAAREGVQKMGAHSQLGDSMTSTLWSKDAFAVSTVPLTFVLDKILDECNFIKMDIEGGEAEVLPAAVDYFKVMQKKPTLYLSLHTPWFENKNEFFDKIIPFLSLYKHVFNTKGEEITLKQITENPERFSSVVATDL